MNSASIKQLKRFQSKYWHGRMSVLDVGSACVNGDIAGRELWPVGTDYTGADIQAGRNVDVVIPPDIFTLGRQFDVVVCTSCLEHVERPWITFPCLVEHVKQGGYLFVTAPFAFHYHRYPIDAWRYTPDSMRVLCEDAGIQLVESRLVNAWPWQEMTFNWAFWNLWQQFYKGIRHMECLAIAQKC